MPSRECTIKHPRVRIVCIGTELLTGKVNTHTAYLGEKLSALGLTVGSEETVVDDADLMSSVFRRSLKEAEIVISCGGLGPTFDDLTRDVWARVTKRSLNLNSLLVRDIQEKFKSRHIPMPPQNKRQAYVLKGASIVPNPNGTAPGQYLKSGKKILILLPGPARELYPMFETFVIPRLREDLNLPTLIQKSFLSVGSPESKIDALIRPLVQRYQKLYGCDIIHGILASNSIITVKFTVQGKDSLSVRRAASFLARKFKAKLGPYVFGEDNDTLPGIVGKKLLSLNKTLAVAESCTGGLVAKLITDQAGASDYFMQGVVTYSNQSKEKLLGVKPATLKKYGAVSPQTAGEMANGLRLRARVDCALSVTGIAGPGGGSATKPVGLVYIACATPWRTVAHEFKFSGDRSWIRHRSAIMALNLLRKELLHVRR